MGLSDIFGISRPGDDYPPAPPCGGGQCSSSGARCGLRGCYRMTPEEWPPAGGQKPPPTPGPGPADPIIPLKYVWGFVAILFFVVFFMWLAQMGRDPNVLPYCSELPWWNRAAPCR